jgi:GNAT superfamily N-acetyltransferase
LQAKGLAGVIADKEMAAVIRPARDAEARACRLLMPEAFSATYAPELWVALDPVVSSVIGAGAVGWQPMPPGPGFPVQVHVIPSHRRRGIGTSLLQAIVDACTGHTGHLHSWASEVEGSPAAAFCAAVGFVPRSRLFEFDADGMRFYTMIKSIHDRLAKSGKIPPELRIVSLREAPLEQVTALVSSQFADVPLSTVMALSKGRINYDQDKSAVLMRGDHVKGALLYLWTDGNPVIDVNVVAPELRHGAGNVLLLEAATRKALEGGSTGFRFHCEEHVRDSLNLARRSGAKLAAVRLAFSRTLARS